VAEALAAGLPSTAGRWPPANNSAPVVCSIALTRVRPAVKLSPRQLELNMTDEAIKNLPCAVCGREVNLRSARSDERGQAIHEECYVTRMIEPAAEKKAS
jgi:hypothetical protein